ncbi:MAG: hypothetical protein KJ593_02585 [Candidatus Omnitrophica bacterium]|nr:hypothetical protein [Candidatus Omnitrophota bacterium]
MKNKIFITTVIILLYSFICYGQGGLYSIVDPEGKNNHVKIEWHRIEQIINSEIKDITIIEFNGGWKDVQEAKKQLLEKLNDKEVKVSSVPLWNMDIAVELVGIIEFQEGSQGKIAVAQYRVGFQDNTGKPWYFQWDERMPFKPTS